MCVAKISLGFHMSIWIDPRFFYSPVDSRFPQLTSQIFRISTSSRFELAFVLILGRSFCLVSKPAFHRPNHELTEVAPNTCPPAFVSLVGQRNIGDNSVSISIGLLIKYNPLTLLRMRSSSQINGYIYSLGLGKILANHYLVVPCTQPEMISFFSLIVLGLEVVALCLSFLLKRKTPMKKWQW